MIQNANKWGWGFENIKYENVTYNRNFSTIWALRVLNAWGFHHTAEFSSILELLVERAVENYGLGFSIETAPKRSITAMLYILVSELENEELKAKVEERLNGANVFQLLLQTKCPETEVEEYLISLENYNKLSWTHLCECLVIHAIALNYSQLNGVEITSDNGSGEGIQKLPRMVCPA